jgi:hypothetical protein
MQHTRLLKLTPSTSTPTYTLLYVTGFLKVFVHRLCVREGPVEELVKLVPPEKVRLEVHVVEIDPSRPSADRAEALHCLLQPRFSTWTALDQPVLHHRYGETAMISNLKQYRPVIQSRHLRRVLIVSQILVNSKTVSINSRIRLGRVFSTVTCSQEELPPRFESKPRGSKTAITWSGISAGQARILRRQDIRPSGTGYMYPILVYPHSRA